MVHYIQGPTLRFRQILSAVSELEKKKKKKQLTSTVEWSHLGCKSAFTVTNVQSRRASATLETQCLRVNGRRQVWPSCRSRHTDVYMNISRLDPT